MSVKSRTVYVRPTTLTRSTNFGGTVRTEYSMIQVIRSRSGVPVNNWKQRIRNNVSATGAFSGTQQFVKLQTGNTNSVTEKGYFDPARNTYVTFQETIDGMFFQFSGFPGHNGFPGTSANNQALTRAHQSIRQQSTHFSGGTFLGELRESIGTIRNLSRKIAKLTPRYLDEQQQVATRYLGKVLFGQNGSAIKESQHIRAVRRINDRYRKIPPKTWAQLRKELSDNYLGYVFGIRPMVQDVIAAAETAARYQNDSRREVVRSYGHAEASTLVDAGNGAPGTHTSIKIFRKETKSTDVVYRIGLQYSVSSPAFGSADRLRTLAGFTLEEFVPTVWNLLPYSFLVDYFLNVGDILSCATTDTSGVRWCCRSEVSTSERLDTGKAYANSPSTYVGGDVGYMSSGTKSVSRSESLVGIPSPEVSLPGLGPGEYGNQQWLNIVALLSSGSGARGPRF